MSNIPGVSQIRDSVIVANQPIINSSQIVTPTNRFRREVYHTPAIIQTVVDTPQDQIYHPSVQYSQIVPQQSFTQNVAYKNTLPVSSLPFGNAVHKNVVSTMNYHPQQGRTYIPNGNILQPIGVKVTQDLSSLKPVTSSKNIIFNQGKLKQSNGCFGRFLKLFWGNNCPLWICCLFPFFTILLIWSISYFISRQRYLFGENSPNFSVVDSTNSGGLDIVQPIVSTDVNRIPNFSSITSTNNPPSVVPSYQQNPYSYPNPGYNSTINPNSNTRYPLSSLTNSYSNLTQQIAGLNERSGLAPTIQQVQTKAMIEADGYKRAMMQQQKRFHLRFNVS